jgi:hypothetical protein
MRGASVFDFSTANGQDSERPDLAGGLRFAIDKLISE